MESCLVPFRPIEHAEIIIELRTYETLRLQPTLGFGKHLESKSGASRIAYRVFINSKLLVSDPIFDSGLRVRSIRHGAA